MRKISKGLREFVSLIVALAKIVRFILRILFRLIRDNKDKSYQSLNSSFSKDATQCYFGKTPIADSDVASFEALDYNYARDKSAVFFCDSRYESTGHLFPPFRTKITITKIEGAALDGFMSLGFSYAKNNTIAFFKNHPFAVDDLPTLTAIHLAFTRDDHRVYFNSVVVSDSDGKTFQLIDDSFQGFARDAKYGYYFTLHEIIKIHCHAATFEKIEDNYAKDKESVYYAAAKLMDSDPETFQYINSSYGKDKNSVYCHQLKIEGADPDTFKILSVNEDFIGDLYFAADNKLVYWQEKKMPEADPATFIVLGRNYASDKKHVYYKNNIMKKVSPATFTVSPHGFGVNAKIKFFEGERI